MEQVGRSLVVIGLVTACAGGVLWFLSRQFPGVKIGRLPGDIAVDQGNVRFYFPLTTMLIISALITLIVWLVGVMRR